MERQLRERTGLTDESDKSRGDGQQALLVPHGGGGGAGSYAPPKDLLIRHSREQFCRSLQDRGRGGESVCGQQSEAIKKHMVRTRRACRLRNGQDGSADLPGITFRVWPGLASGDPGGHVNLARKFGVKGLESLPGAEQEWRSLATAVTRGPGDMAADKVHTCSLGLVERAILRASCEPERGVKGAGL